MGDIYMSNLSITNLHIIFQLHLVIVVAPKAVISEFRSESKLGAVDLIWGSAVDFCGFEGIFFRNQPQNVYTLNPHRTTPQTSKRLQGMCITILQLDSIIKKIISATASPSKPFSKDLVGCHQENVCVHANNVCRPLGFVCGPPLTESAPGRLSAD